jgi:CheY-like chemotaxis protein
MSSATGRPPHRRSGTRPRTPLALLVEDLSELRTALAEALELEGFSVVQARDGREAVAQALRLLPDVILLDLSLPVMDGASAARVIKLYAPAREIPIIAFTGMSVGTSEARALGLDGVIRKPCAPQAVAAALRAALRPWPDRRRAP